MLQGNCTKRRGWIFDLNWIGKVSFCLVPYNYCHPLIEALTQYVMFSFSIWLQPARLWDTSKDSLMNVLKFRLFFKLRLKDSDFAAGDIESKNGLGLFQSMNNLPPHLMVGSIVLSSCFRLFSRCRFSQSINICGTINSA